MHGKQHIKKLDVCLSVLRCLCVEKKNQLDVTEWFIALIIFSTCFQAVLCPSSGARDYMCAIAAYGVQCLVVGCRRSGAGQQAMRPE